MSIHFGMYDSFNCGVLHSILHNKTLFLGLGWADNADGGKSCRLQWDPSRRWLWLTTVNFGNTIAKIIGTYYIESTTSETV